MQDTNRRTRVVQRIRIAVSAVCGIACVLLIALWVRSYRWHDELQVGRTVVLAGVFSNQGQLGFAKHLPYLDWNGRLILLTRPIEDEFGREQRCRFYWKPDGGNFWAGVPHWFAVMSIAIVAVLPWTPMQYSLRSLLIGITLIAVAMGLVVAVS